MLTRRMLGAYVTCWLAAVAVGFHVPFSPFHRSEASLSRKVPAEAQESGRDSKDMTRVARAQSATRRESLGSLGGVLGGLAFATMLPGTGPRPAMAARKSPKEVQFELFKMYVPLRVFFIDPAALEMEP